MSKPIYEKKIFPIALKINKNTGQIDEQTTNTLQKITLNDVDIEDMNGNDYSVKTCFSRKQMKAGIKIECGIPVFSGAVDLDIGLSQQSEEETTKRFFSFNLSRFFKKVRIPEQKIKTSDGFNQKIKEALSRGNDEKTFQELNKIFADYGSVVPTTIIFGGKLNVQIESTQEISAMQVEANVGAKCKFAKVNCNISNTSNSFFDENSSHTTTLGGKTSTDDLNRAEKWYESISEDNIDIIEYKDLVPIHEFLPEDLKTQVLSYKDFVPENKKKYYEIFKDPDHSDEVPEESDIYKCDPGFFEIQCGYTDENNDYLRKFKFIAYKKAAQGILGWYENTAVRGETPINTRIVGWKIRSRRRNHNYNGYVTVRHDPLQGNHRTYDFYFESCVKRDIGYDVYLYYFPIKDY